MLLVKVIMWEIFCKWKGINLNASSSLAVEFYWFSQRCGDEIDSGCATFPMKRQFQRKIG